MSSATRQLRSHACPAPRTDPGGGQDQPGDLVGWETAEALLERTSTVLAPTLAECTDHYNVHRPHRALGQAPPLRPGVPVVLAPPARIVRRDRLGGLIHEYAQVA
jgi:hypothetical protein